MLLGMITIAPTDAQENKFVFNTEEKNGWGLFCQLNLQKMFRGSIFMWKTESFSLHRGELYI